MALVCIGCGERDAPRQRREPTLVARPAERAAMEPSAVRGIDTAGLKGLLDHYATVDSLLHAVERPPFQAHVETDALLADLPLEAGQRSLRSLLERRYGVLYEGRAAGVARGIGHRFEVADSVFMTEVAALLRQGIVRHDSVYATLRGEEARTVVRQSIAAERKALDRLLRLHPGPD